MDDVWIDENGMPHKVTGVQDIVRITQDPATGDYVALLSDGQIVPASSLTGLANLSVANPKSPITDENGVVYQPESELAAVKNSVEMGLGELPNLPSNSTVNPLQGAGSVRLLPTLPVLSDNPRILENNLGNFVFDGIPVDTTTTTGGGGGGGSGGSGYGYYPDYNYNSGYYDGPRVQYANGWIPPMFGGSYTYQQWLAMQNPPDYNDWSGPARLPELPESFNLNVFGENGPPGNPFYNNSGGGYGGYGGYGGGGNSDYQPPLAKELYWKFAGNARSAAGGDPTQSDYDRAQRKQQQDYRQNERDYQTQQAAYNMRQNPIWGFETAFGKDAGASELWGLYNNMPLDGLQYLLNSKANPKKFEDPSKYQKQLQQMYKQISGDGDVLDYSSLKKAAFGGGRNSLIASLFQEKQSPQSQYDNNGLYTGMRTPRSKWADPSSQVGAMGMLINSMYRSTMDPSIAYSMSQLANQRMGNWAYRQYGKKNANHYGDIRRYMKDQVL